MLIFTNVTKNITPQGITAPWGKKKISRIRLCHLGDGVAALLHEPTGGAGGTADANGVDAVEPFWLDLTGVFDEMAVGIHPQTLVKEYLAVRTFTTADEENQVVLRGEGRDIRHAVGYRPADSIETLEVSFR